MGRIKAVSRIYAASQPKVRGRQPHQYELIGDIHQSSIHLSTARSADRNHWRVQFTDGAEGEVKGISRERGTLGINRALIELAETSLNAKARAKTPDTVAESEMTEAF